MSQTIKPPKLYHYTSFDSFVKIWLSKQLKFGNVSTVNDICELFRLNYSIVLRENGLDLLNQFRDIVKSYKQISLTQDDKLTGIKGCMHPVMWGIYADKRKGVCIELDYNEIERLVYSNDCIAKSVIYEKNLPPLHVIPNCCINEESIKEHINKNLTPLFFTKSESWKMECEYRIISDNKEFLDITNAITAVYLTSYNSEECVFTEKLVNKEVPVKFIKYVSNTDNYAEPKMFDTEEFRKKEEGR